MKNTRLAVLTVNREFLESILPGWREVVWLRYRDMVTEGIHAEAERIADPYRRALKLPADCRITGISHNAFFGFDRDRIAFRIESPDFVETPDGTMLPVVDAIYRHCLPGLRRGRAEDVETRNLSVGVEGFPGSAEVVWYLGYFFRWEGPAVETRRTYGPDGKETEAEGVRANLRVSNDCFMRWEDLFAAVDPPPPNPMMSWREYRAAVNWCVANSGVAYVWKVRNAFGVETERWLLSPNCLRRGPDGYYTVRLDAERTFTLPAAEVEELRSVLPPETANGASPVDGAEVVGEGEQWLRSGVIAGAARTAGPCWKCGENTSRKLPDGTAECEDCAAGPLL